MKGFRLVQDFYVTNEGTYLREKVVKNPRYDGNDGAALEFQKGLQLILVKSHCPLKGCWTDSLWEAKGDRNYCLPKKG